MDSCGLSFLGIFASHLVPGPSAEAMNCALRVASEATVEDSSALREADRVMPVS